MGVQCRRNTQFYKPFSNYQNFVVSPVNIIPQIFFNIENNQTATFQILFSPLPGNITHDLVKDAIDCEWRALQGADSKVVPSLQPTSEKIEYKSPELKSFFAVAPRIILPYDLQSEVRAFVANYTYGSCALSILNSRYYSHEQIFEMFHNRLAYSTGWLVNAFELCAILHPPYQILFDKKFNGIFAAAPAGDFPVKTAEYEDVSIGLWACGNSKKQIHLPIQREIPGVQVLGLPRSGKSVLLSHIALEKFERREATVVFDPHGDLIDSILRRIPKNRISDVVVLDFGIAGYIPQITIRGNVDIANPDKAADDLAVSMRETTVSGTEKYFGVRMSYFFCCLFLIYSTLPDLTLADIRLLISRTPKAKALRQKVKARISNPIVREFLDEVDVTGYEALLPVLVRLSHLLLPESSFRLLTLDENKISINDIMENGRLLLVNLAVGVIGKQRSSILSGLVSSFVNNNAFSRAAIPYEKRKPCLLIVDECHLSPMDFEQQLTELAKYGVSVIFAHQYLSQVSIETREVMGTAGTRIIFKPRRVDAEVMGRDFGILPEEFTDLSLLEKILNSNWLQLFYATAIIPLREGIINISLNFKAVAMTLLPKAER